MHDTSLSAQNDVYDIRCRPLPARRQGNSTRDSFTLPPRRIWLDASVAEAKRARRRNPPGTPFPVSLALLLFLSAILSRAENQAFLSFAADFIQNSAIFAVNPTLIGVLHKLYINPLYACTKKFHLYKVCNLCRFFPLPHYTNAPDCAMIRLEGPCRSSRLPTLLCGKAATIHPGFFRKEGVVDVRDPRSSAAGGRTARPA